MPIEVACTCGRSFKAKDEHAGLRAKCPACGAAIQIPAAAQQQRQAPSEFNLADLHEGLEEDHVSAREQPSLADVCNVLNAILDRINNFLSNAPAGPSAASGGKAHGPREYKVVTQKDKWFSGKFDPEKVEGALNSYARQGWSLKGVATASVPGFGGMRDEIIIIMER